MPLPDLTPDCRNCDALCCVLLAFDRSRAFAFDKPAFDPCRNLALNRCTIHTDLAARGFPGCIAFNCHGAGQYITQTVFKGRPWRDDPSLMPALDQAFRILRRLHEALVLLQQAAALDLTAAQDATRQTLIETLAAPRDEQALQGPEPLLALSEAARFFASLRGLTPPRR
ncbi:MAG: hypothetical protein H7245_20665 [Candidatus Saccharibacteria bacterium]|nr:hypothetical protein [Pseudorhodobacter sp.]